MAFLCPLALNSNTRRSVVVLAYSGRLNGEAKPDLFHVGADPNILYRVNRWKPLTTLSAYSGGRVRTLVIDPQNHQTFYVVDFLCS